jgi:hypothetical protein
MIKNSIGTIYYGMHFYPGLAQYNLPSGEDSKILLNESTLRRMDPTFAGRPIFVEHVDQVDKNIDEVRKEADGWVVESFFNDADGKHWVKFVVVSSNAEQAIKNGFALSNAYIPKFNNKEGVWNNIQYDNEVIDGTYEHLAIVKNPRYDESIILTPEEFKKYNEKLKLELNKIANSKKETSRMDFKFWKKTTVENSLDFDSISVTLPRCKKDFSISQLINEIEKVEEKKAENMADPEMKVKLYDGTMCNVSELVDKHKEMAEKIASLMEKKDEDNSIDDEEAKKKALELAKHEDEEIKKEKLENSIKAKKNFDSLKNAEENSKTKNNIEISLDKIARGKSKYGSNK